MLDVINCGANVDTRRLPAISVSRSATAHATRGGGPQDNPTVSMAQVVPIEVDTRDSQPLAGHTKYTLPPEVTVLVRASLGVGAAAFFRYGASVIQVDSGAIVKRTSGCIG
jgi:hypothetical protein